MTILTLTKESLKYNADRFFACFAPPEPSSISVCNPAGGILINVLIHALMIERKVQKKTLLNELRISRILGKVAFEFHIK